MKWAALLVLVTFAAWRTWALTARDLILDRWRDRWAPVGTTKRDWLECPYCSGFWWAGVWVIALSLSTGTPDTWDGIALTVASWWAAAAGVILIELLVDWVSAHT